MKDFLKKIDIDKIKKFCIEKKRYIGAVGLFVVFVLVLAFMAKPSASKKTDGSTESTASVAESFAFDKDYSVDGNEAITNLLNNYYTAYVADDLDSLEKIAYPISNNEKSYIGVLSQYYESIQNIKYYSKAGLTDGSYFVSVYNEIKFYGVDTLAPTLDFFYVETDADGNMHINNLYSIFNLSFVENTMDSDVYAVVQKYMQQEDFTALQQEVQTKYNEALTADANLANMIQSTLDGAIKQWAASINTIQDTTEGGTEVTPDTEAMLIIFPAFCFTIILDTNLIQLKVPFKLVFITASKSSSFIAMQSPSFVIPALLTRISRRPCSFTTSLIIASQAAKSLTLHLYMEAFPPFSSMVCFTSFALSSEPL